MEIVQERRHPNIRHRADRADDTEGLPAVEQLKGEPGTDVLVLQSQQVVSALLADDLVDDLHLTVVPVILGGGLRLLPEGVDGSGWTTANVSVLEHGAIAAHWRRDR